MRILELSGDYFRGREGTQGSIGWRTARGPEQADTDTLALKDAVLASALASSVTAIHITTKLCCLPLLPSHWQGDEDTRLHHALGWNRKTAGLTAKPTAQHSAAIRKGGTSDKLNDGLGRFCFIWQYGS